MSLDRRYEIIDEKQGAPYFVFPDGLTLVGSGGGADVYRDSGHSDVAFKVYRVPSQVDWTKIAYQIDNQIRSKTRPATARCEFAWPHGLIREGGKSVGIVLPYIDRTKWISLDNWTEPRLLKSLSTDNASLSRRLAILRSLAKRIADLHARHIAVIDLRPSNTLVHVGTGDVCLIDCDSFRIEAPNGLVFGGSHVSAGYISPEAITGTLDIGSLNKEQDLYAFAVIAFQVLNYGIHPFQGILTDDGIDAGTDDEKAKLGLYAYGLTPSKAITPLPQSVHTCWPDDLRRIFTKAFALGEVRPSARKWRSIFNKILFHKMLQRCHRHPKDPRHIHFLDFNCGACRREKLISEIRQRTPTAAPRTVALSTPMRPIPPQPTKNGLAPIIFAGAVILLYVVFRMATGPDPQTSDQQPSPSAQESPDAQQPPQSPTDLAVARPNSTDVAPSNATEGSPNAAGTPSNTPVGSDSSQSAPGGEIGKDNNSLGTSADSAALDNLPKCPEGIFSNCVGSSTYPDGSQYTGQWQDGKREGQGTYWGPTGEKYEGSWKNDRRDGAGITTSRDGTRTSGIWKDGALVN